MICKFCNDILHDLNWSKSRQKRNKHICKYCENNQNKLRYKKYKDKYLNNYKKQYLKTKASVIEYYGGKCDMCGIDNFEYLSIDHIDGYGRKHRKEVLGTDSGTAFYKWVFKNKPNNLRVLCYNCNCQRNSNLEKRKLVYSYYGNKCICGESDIRYLTIDHINNNGNEHRKEIGTDIYSWLIANNYPKDNYQILCYNCNYAKRNVLVYNG